LTVTPTAAPIEAGAIAAPALSRDLRQRHVTMISIGGIIGAGLFVGSSAGIASIGPAVVVSYLLAGLVVLLVMRQLGEMAAANPNVGSFTEFARQGLGNWAGFVAGWTYWYFWVAVVCVEALAGAKLLHAWVDLPIWAWGVILLAAMASTNLWSTRSYAEFEFWFASIKVVAIVVFIVIAAVALGLHSPSPAGRLANLTADHGFAPFGILSVLGGVTSVVFALTGAEIATIAAAESDEPGKAVARMTNQVVLRILLFYVISIFLIVTLVPWRTIHPGDSPFAITLERLGIPGAPIVMNLIVLTAVLSCLNSGLYVCSRVLFTLAAHGDAPAGMVAVNRRKVPVRAILVVMAFALVAMATSAWMPNLFGFLIDASGALMLVVYGLVSLAQIVLRRRADRDAPGSLVVRMWLFPWLSWFAVAAMVAILAVMGLTPASFHQFLASMAVPLAALAAFFLLRRGRATSA
jgi:L-asparagine transporter-like permease